MNTSIDTTGLLSNSKPVNGASNPYECHTFEYQVEYSDILEPTEEVVSTEWSLSGDIPVGISINENGLISGRIATFMDQPSCQDNYPNEDTKLDGSNWTKNGRYKYSSYEFNFTVTRKVTYIDTMTEEELIEVASSNVSILVIKNNDVTNLIFIKKYLEAGHELKIGNDTYRLEDIDNFLVRHPGPFGCN